MRGEFPRRLTRPPTPTAGAALARNPSYRAPDVSELARVTVPDLPAGPTAPEERRLLAAVLAAPTDDGPRLAFADYCDELGDPRGPFIRAQLADPTAQAPADIAAAARELFAAVSAEDLVWRRGFVEGVSLSGRAFIALGDWVARQTPLNEVRLVAVQPYLGELAAATHLAHLRTLNLRGNRIGPAGLATLLASPHLAADALNLAVNNLTADDVPTLPPVRRLDLSGNALGSEVAWPTWHFDVLDLDGVGLGLDGALRLAASGVAAVSLDLGFNALTDAGVAAVVDSPLGRGCRWLGLRGNRLTPVVREILAGFAGAVDLRANFL
jgi:uncharacterized protein (TIGR02996 family)